MKYCPDIVTSLTANQVFVFGSNGQGFHGAGSAGYAFRGTADNNWRNDAYFLAAKAPVGSPLRIGNWAVYGISRGYQEGHIGKSYAIQTVTRPGVRRSVSSCEILIQLEKLTKFAWQHPNLEFLSSISGGGYNGYTIYEIQHLHEIWCLGSLSPPRNILLKKKYEFRQLKYE